MTLVQHYIAVIKRYKKDLLKVTDIVVADAFFSIRPFVDGIKEYGFHLVSRFRDTASLLYYYVYTGPRSNKPGHPKTLDGKVRLVIWVMMKENGMPYSMDSFKEIMASTYIAKLIFDKCRSIPNRKLISYTIKELFGWQRKAA